MLGIAVFLLETSKCAESSFWVYVDSRKLVPLAKGMRRCLTVVWVTWNILLRGDRP